MSAHGSMPRSAWVFPTLAVLFFAIATLLSWTFTHSAAGLAYAAIVLIILFGTVFAAVHHAEVIAQRVGEPYGTLVLTMAVTVIEVAVIATIMLGEKEVPTLARDTVFAVVMIVCNGLVGICIMSGGFRYREQDFQITGANVYLSVLIVLATITLILPNYTLTTPGPFYSVAQLAFVSCVTLLLYGVFLYTQTIRHRDYFTADNDDGEAHAGFELDLDAALRSIGPFFGEDRAFPFDFRPVRKGAVDIGAGHREALEGGEVQACVFRRGPAPLPPCLAKIEAGAEAELGDAERLPALPAVGQVVAGKEDMAAFQPPVAAAIKVIVKGTGIGHIALVPVEDRFGPGRVLRIVVSHGECR